MRGIIFLVLFLSINLRGLESRATFSNQCESTLFEPGYSLTHQGQIQLHLSKDSQIRGQALNLVARALEWPLGVAQINQSLKAFASDTRDEHYFTKMADALRVQAFDLGSSAAHIPKEGPLLVVANHVAHGLDGLALARLLVKVRPDVKIMVNSFLQDIPGIGDHAFFVNPYETKEAVRQNLPVMKQMIDYLRKGGALIVFPAGAVSSRQNSKAGFAVDRPWIEGVASLIHHVEGIQIVPSFVHGEPHPFYELVKKGPALGAMLSHIRAIATGVNEPFRVVFGSAVKKEALQGLERAEIMKYLYALTFLHHPGNTARVGQFKSPRRFKKIIDPVAAELQFAEIKELVNNPENFLVNSSSDDSRGYVVTLAQGKTIPHLLREIGRLREQTFRLEGEGSGEELDLDKFDLDFYHLILWDKDEQRIVGAYRLGLTDQNLLKRGLAGVYSQNFFDLSGLAKKGDPSSPLHASIELGRSFIVPEKQGSATALLSLWRGIGTFLVRNPQYRYLFGPVSVPDTFSDASKNLILSYVKLYHWHPWADQVVPRQEPKFEMPLSKEDLDLLLRIKTNVNWENMVRDRELGRPVPPLIVNYANMNAKALGFSFDREFNSMDVLMWTDITQIPERMLKLYMGGQGLQSYRQYWQHREESY